MGVLNRKLVRDLLAMKTQLIAICFVIAAGVATFVMSVCTLTSLRLTQERYYEQFRFPQIFAHLKRAPQSLSARIAAIPGVAAVETRVVVDVTLDVPGLSEPAVGRLISFPDGGPRLNQLHLRQGRFIEPGARGEVMVGEAFAEAHQFRVGDQIKAVINGKLQPLRIVGVALSPEYIYAIRGGDIWPDDKRFGVLWMHEDELAAAYDLTGAFNDLCLTSMRGESEPDIIARLDRLIDPYGGQGAYGRSEQTSHEFVSNEMAQLRAMALVPPTIFLSVAAFLLNVVVSRLIKTQREQIAALKAFGYTAGEIGWHYLKSVLLVTMVGLLLGTSAGAWLGVDLTQIYTRFFRFPELEFQLSPWVLLVASAVALAAAVFAAGNAVRRAMQLPPAEAMRPEPPATYRPLLLERVGLQHWLSQTARMVVRRLERRPLLAFLSCLGIALAVAILTLGTFTEDIVDYLNEVQFDLTQRQDLSVAFVEPASRTTLHELTQVPGVVAAEPFRSVPARFRSGARSRRVSIMGVLPNSTLYRVVDMEQRTVALPPEGLVLTAKLAERLEVNVGDPVTIEVLEGSRPVRTAVIRDIMKSFSGAGLAYMDLGAMNRMMLEGPIVSGAFLSVDAARNDHVFRTLKETPRVASVTSLRAARESFEDIVSQNLLRMRLFNVGFACVIAFGVVYNCARITLSEQSRDLATLRVVGLTRREISSILLGEIGVLTAVAIPLGLCIGYGLAALAVWALETDTQQFPLIVTSSTYSFAATVTLVAATLSSLVVRRRLDTLDLVAVLKARE